MILKEVLKEVVIAQRQDLEKLSVGISREKLSDLDISLPFATIISGIRRCGKSTLLKQALAKLKNYYYLNFEDTRLTNFDVSDFTKLTEVFVELYGNSDYYIFDEIQNVNNWEIFVREMLDKKKKFLITGSNASLLSKELGTKLTGRHLVMELYPFDFNEFLKYKKLKQSKQSFDSYFKLGGFPEYLKYDRIEILQQLLKDILYRDIVVRYNIKESNALEELSLYLMSNIGKEFSYNNLKKMLNLGSVNSVISFIKYLEDSYLFFSIPCFDYSIKKQQNSPKKIYSIDLGMINCNSKSFSQDKGRLLENVVFLKLKQDHKNIYYYKDNVECDFMIKNKTKIDMAIQVCYDLNKDNYDREVNGLLSAMSKFNLNTGTIITYNNEDKFIIDKKTIYVKSIWKWLLE